MRTCLRTDGGLEPAITVQNLTKTYGNSLTAVDDVSLEIASGSVVGLLGPNGAGKTTTIKSILGLIVPTDGHVRIDGHDVYAEPRSAYRDVSAVLEGARNVYWRLTVRENLRFFARLHGNDPPDSKRLRRYAELLNFEEKLDEPVQNLSLGMKQKTALACAFARETPILFLDEPTLGLDVETARDLRRELRRFVEAEDRTVVLSSHDMDTVQELCDRVVIMNRGRIVANDEVDELVDLFCTQSYRIAVSGRPSDRARSRLEKRFNAREFEETATGVEFTVLIEEGGQLYECMDQLREDGLTPDAVDTLEPDLEEAFVRIIESDRTETPLTAGERT